MMQQKTPRRSWTPPAVLAQLYETRLLDPSFDEPEDLRYVVPARLVRGERLE